jgi:ribonuclease HI
MASERNDDAYIKIYTDGSGCDGGVGAAAVMFKGKSKKPSHTLRYHLGKPEDHSTYEAETIGIYLATHMLHTSCKNDIGRESITIYTDNQSAVKMAKSDGPGPAQHIRKKFLMLTDTLERRGERRGHLFTIRWISAHSDVHRNEAMDAEAKRAARGESSNPLTLPRPLRRSLPRSKSAIQQQRKIFTKAQWLEDWLQSPRCEKFRALEDEFPFKTFYKIVADKRRAHSSLLTQIRTGHIPLNAWLHRRKLAPTDKCRKCNTNQRDHPTLHHGMPSIPTTENQDGTEIRQGETEPAAPPHEEKKHINPPGLHTRDQTLHIGP